MTTADVVDNSVSAGIKRMKRKMVKMKEEIAEHNQKADRMEKELFAARTHLLGVYTTGQNGKDRMEEIRDELEHNEKKFLELEHRVLEREEFVKRSRESAGRINIVTVDEQLLAQTQQEYEEKKQEYNANMERLQLAETKKKDLDQRHEELEWTNADHERALHKLKIELEYNLLEEERRSKTSRDIVEAAFAVEKSCTDLQRGLDVIMRRKGEATRKLNEYELRIHKTEDAYEAVSFERRRIEAAIREILLSSVRKL